MPTDIKPAEGRLGVLMPGMGAVATTFIAGVEAVKAGLGKPIGSLTQLGTIRLGLRTDDRSPKIKDFVPLAGLDDLVFGGWDIFDESVFTAAKRSGVLEEKLLDTLKPQLDAIRPMPAVFDQKYVKKLHGTHVKGGASWMEKARALMDDIERFKRANDVDRVVMVWCASTEIFIEPKPVHRTIEAFELGLMENDPDIAPSMVYAYAAIKTGTPFANGAPNLSCDTPALVELAKREGVPIGGKLDADDEGPAPAPLFSPAINLIQYVDMFGNI